MPFNLTFLIAIFSLHALILNGQTYQPVGIENAHWFMHSINQDYSANHHAYVIRGDTTIDNIDYKKIYYQDLGNDPFLEPPYLLQNEYLWGAIRDDIDQRKVFVRGFDANDIGNCIANQEHLLYDFSASVGDSIIQCLAYEDIPYIVDSVYTTSIYGQSRRTMYTNRYDFDGMLYEGIGSYGGGLLSTPDYLISIDGQDFFHLQEYCIGSDSECNVIVTSTSFVNQHASRIKVFPNPTSGEVTISKGKLSFSRIQVLDITGREVQNILNEFNSTENFLQIDLGILPNGVYFLIYWQDGKFVFQNKIILHH